LFGEIFEVRTFIAFIAFIALLFSSHDAAGYQLDQPYGGVYEAPDRSWHAGQVSDTLPVVELRRTLAS
jgi:hypothetical protein